MKLKTLLPFSAAALLALATVTISAQAPTGKIHGHVTDPTGVPKAEGTVGLSLDQGHTFKYTFPVNASGDYSGDNIAPNTYAVTLRMPDTAPGQLVDMIDNVKIVAGQDTLQDIDLSRKEYLDKMTPEQRKQVEEFKKKNADVMKTNQMVKQLNADLAVAGQDVKDGDSAHAAAIAALGATASKTDIAAKETEIKTAKYGEAETLMKKDTGLKPDGAVLWVYLGNAETGLGKYDDAEAAYKKALETNAASKGKPAPDLDGAANSGLGTVYAHQKKVAEAVAAYDAAAKAMPTQSSFYYSNFTKLLYSLNSTGVLSDPDAQAAAADKAIAATPANNTPAYALLFYLKAQALTQKASFDAKTQKITLPPGTAEAYQKYLEIDPNGTFANDAKEVLASAGQKVDSKYKAPKK
jgi:tetratricopeptide (TPR) repeat protein